MKTVFVLLRMYYDDTEVLSVHPTKKSAEKARKDFEKQNKMKYYLEIVESPFYQEV